MNESELYKELGTLTKDRERWETSIPYVSSLLSHDSVKIQAKALWLLGEMGLTYPQSVQNTVSDIAAFCDSPVSILRERAVNALGRIGRGNYILIEPFWEDLFRFASDEDPKVRLSFIWASENIATNTPDIYEKHMSVFAELLGDTDDKVRMEAPEIFRVLCKRRPEFVRPYLEQLQRMAETDQNRVVRIHCQGAIKAAERYTTRALYILAANAQWDEENRFDLILPDYLKHITDDKPITARQCVKALAQVGLARPQYIPQILSALRSADLSKYKDSMRPLIERDMEETEMILINSQRVDLFG